MPRTSDRSAAKGRSKNELLSPAIKNLRKISQKTRMGVLHVQSVTATSAELSKLKSPDRHLTDKQKLFVKKWAAGDSIAGAAFGAGYSDGGQMGYRMARDPAIVALYNAEKVAYEKAVGMSRERVMNGLEEAIDMARTLADPQAMIAGWREVGKMCGYYAPVQVKVDVNINDNSAYARLSRMSDAELLALAEKDKLVLDVEAVEVGRSKTPLLELREEAEEVDG